MNEWVNITLSKMATFPERLPRLILVGIQVVILIYTPSLFLFRDLFVAGFVISHCIIIMYYFAGQLIFDKKNPGKPGEKPSTQLHLNLLTAKSGK
ncbi:hypothetical protein [Yersinia frederiksenii]|uniref:hypothetical protein n=1 Tax=Yersinia frederiksenii TaxID=29484 RepID=UPI0012D4B845|nr:hypothetical protein [Yersinia frederiksenii]HEC1648201.1 hypothetical protein [Yersinia enterocolitica]